MTAANDLVENIRKESRTAKGIQGHVVFTPEAADAMANLLESLAKDAERYRFIREMNRCDATDKGIDWCWSEAKPLRLDDQIDKAMGEK